MVDSGIFCTGTEVKYKCGAGVSATSSAEAYTNYFIANAESYINSVCRYNFSDNYSTLNTDTKKILNDAASNLAAVYVVMYDMSGYSTRIDAEDIINVCLDRADKAIALLKDKKVQDFIIGS